ncbi:MAG: alpha/beta hydrolase [Eubacteriales bacterium]|nr:alpha/beta hydrolase [Eubacteriales bacterium]
MLKKTHPFWKRLLKSALIFLIALLIILVVAPYLIPADLHSVALPVQPYENSEHFDASGVDLHYQIWDAATPVGKILLIHGFGGSTNNWQQNIDALNQAGYTVVTVDLPGFGYSSRKAGLDHSQAQRSDWLWQLLDDLDQNRFDADLADSSWSIAGHSMGGGTALAMAIAHPERTQKLILIDGAIFDNRPSFVPVLMRFPPLDRWVQVIFNFYLRTPAQLQPTLADAFQQQPTAEQFAHYQAPLMIQGTGRVLGDIVRTAGSVPATLLSDLEVPVFAIWGEQDTWVPQSVLAQIQKLRPDIKSVLIPGAGHMPMESHADLFNEALITILKETLP